MPIANIYEARCFHTHRQRKQYWVLFIMSGAINLLPALYWICYQEPGEQVRAKTKWSNLIRFGWRCQISLPTGFLAKWESLKYICSTSFSRGVCTCTWILSTVLPLVLHDAERQWDNFLLPNKEVFRLLPCFPFKHFPVVNSDVDFSSAVMFSSFRFCSADKGR